MCVCVCVCVCGWGGEVLQQVLLLVLLEQLLARMKRAWRNQKKQGLEISNQPLIVLGALRVLKC